MCEWDVISKEDGEHIFVLSRARRRANHITVYHFFHKRKKKNNIFKYFWYFYFILCNMSSASVLVPLRFIFLISNLLLIVELFDSERNQCHVESSLGPLPTPAEVRENTKIFYFLLFKHFLCDYWKAHFLVKNLGYFNDYKIYSYFINYDSICRFWACWTCIWFNLSVILAADN